MTEPISSGLGHQPLPAPPIAEQPPPESSASRPNTGKRRIGKNRTGERTGESRIGIAEPEYLNLGEALEDVIEERTAAPVPDIIQTLPEGATGSQPAEKVYIQEAAGFRKAGRQQYESSLIERQKQAAVENGELNGEYIHTTAGAIQTGISSQTVFRTMAVTLQGLLAGFSIAHCALSMFDSPPYFSNAHFIEHFAPLALPAHCLYYAVLVICTLAALDRYDVGQSFIRVVYRAVTLQSGGLAVVCYLAAAVVNQTAIAVDERMSLHYHNMTATNDRQQLPLNEQPWMEGDMQLWRGLLIAKTVLVTLAWILIAVRPNTDLLSKHLKQADENFAQEFKDLQEIPKQTDSAVAVVETARN